MSNQTGVVGNFISGTTIFSVLSGQNPVGLDASIYAFDMKKDVELVWEIKELIQEVINTPAPRQ